MSIVAVRVKASSSTTKILTLEGSIFGARIPCNPGINRSTGYVTRYEIQVTRLRIRRSDVTLDKMAIIQLAKD